MAANRKLPVYRIAHFQREEREQRFYANTLREHLQKHHFIQVPHKHDFYMAFWFTAGSGTHEVDFSSYEVKPGYLFLLQPGQTHHWTLSPDTDGYVFFHSRAFYDEAFTSATVRQFPFFQSVYSCPLVIVPSRKMQELHTLFTTIIAEHGAQDLLKEQKLLALVNCVYILLSRLAPSGTRNTAEKRYDDRLQKLESLIDEHFRQLKYARDYAALMNLTEKHLNRLCKAGLNKTIGQLIADRVVLEARRLLVQAQLPVNMVADELGYPDPSYFSRLFKKQTGETPLQFALKYRS